MTTVAECLPLARKACDYLTASPDPYHAVNNAATKLRVAGFECLQARKPFAGKMRPGGKYYYTQDDTAIVAFTIGTQLDVDRPYGFKIIAGHTDSPNLRVKPRSKRTSAGECVQLAVECYGGGLWHTWFDRDLGVSGKVLVRNGSSIESKFVLIELPVARVSNLAIHLATADERAAFRVNKEDHLQPIIGTKSVLEEEAKEQLQDGWTEFQEPELLSLISAELGVEAKCIVDFDLCLFDMQPAAIAGIKSEFVHSGRLDNLATCFVSVEALLTHAESSLAGDTDISIVILFDHEEVGSGSTTGACSPIMSEAVRRISSALSPKSTEDFHSAILRQSFCLSIDMAHALHPNYSNKHEKGHAPELNKGIVIKTNRNQRYATSLISDHILREVARRESLTPPQAFVVRNDCGCGSTIGPTLAQNTGIRTVDAGMPQLSMHSCRETMGTMDLMNGLQLFLAFFNHFREVDNQLSEGYCCDIEQR